MSKRLVLSATVFSVFILRAGVSLLAQNGNSPRLTIESIFAEGGITGRAPEAMQWSPDSTKFSFVQRDDSGEHGELWYVDAATGEKKLLVSDAKLATLAPPASKIKDEREKERVARYNVAAYHWAPDSRHLLFDSMGQLWMFDTSNGVGVQFTSAPEPSGDPKFSPDGGRVAYLRQHNLYVRPVASGNEKQITRDSDQNLLNGEVDWLYAEELSGRSNYFWSPDGKAIAYLQTDETHVPAYPIVNWLTTHPKAEDEKYPKAGDANPTVRLGVVGANGGKTKWLRLVADNKSGDTSDNTSGSDFYIPRFGWVREGVLWAQVLNRTQDKLDLYFIDTHSGKSHRVLQESSPGGWVRIGDDFRILQPGDRFLWTSWRDGHTHLYLYSFNKSDPVAGDAKLERQLTQGAFEVLALAGVDEADGTAYIAANKDDVRQRQLFSVKLEGAPLTRQSKEEGTHEVTFAEDGKHYIDRFSSRLNPPRLSICAVAGSCQPVWKSRDWDRTLDKDKLGLLPEKFLDFKADDGTALQGQLLLPAAGSGNTRVPLIVYVYGGPAEQVVRDEWGGDTELFHQLLAQKGFAIFSVDNRGTPNRDRKFQTAIRHQFGAVELKDQLAAIDQLLAEVPQLDRNRVAIWGWSNGGSMTLYAMTHSDLFKAGVAVAPVTDWHNYDTAYTERYLGTPKENPKGYEESSLPAVAGQLHGSLLLVHGSSDDNVHLQNSIQMIDALIKAEKQFRFMVYPDKTHGIGGPAASMHLFHMIEDQFERELK